MQLVLLRILLGAAFLYVLREAAANARTAPETGDGTNAVLLALALIVGLANAAVWAPFFGARLSAPLTQTFTDGAPYEHSTRLLNLARHADQEGRRRTTIFFCLLETWWRPHQPAAFLMGLKCAQPGSWFHRHCALRVFRFDNAAHSIDAYQTLRKHGIDPRPHRNPEINAILLALDRKPSPSPPRLVPVPQLSTQPRLQRDSRIRLFSASQDGSPPGTTQPPV
jgi:hypothetical protein